MTPRASVAEVSAPGRGAIATLRVWGPDAVEVVASAFRPIRGPGLAQGPAGRPRVGRIGAGLGDEVVVVVLETDPPEVEVQCHGGPGPVALVVAALVAAGATLRPPRAWARHTWGSKLRADAALALAGSSTLRAAAILLDQAEGALDDELRAILDLADDDALERFLVERVAPEKGDRHRPSTAGASPLFLDRSDQSGTALTALDALIARAEVGCRLVTGWRVVLAGRPNVGKSRLLNALAGFDRAIVDPRAGTTRDVVTAATALGGWPVELADTAGLRPTADPIEAQGVALARAHQGAADLVLVVLDRSEPWADDDWSILQTHPGALVAANKSDLPGAWHEADLGALPVSAERGDGIGTLVDALAARLVPEVPPPGSGVPFRSIQVRRLRAIRDRLAAGDCDRARRSLGRWLDKSG